ncbi:unnamed protein product [Timema podura]|uniref:Uncharacterized protein n=1 Tax=Timema podura TaxID=61482 RepID=A0ABN7NJQ5_TIMPD|nr:unnamed protein product [Timema podura]
MITDKEEYHHRLVGPRSLARRIIIIAWLSHDHWQGGLSSSLGWAPITDKEEYHPTAVGPNSDQPCQSRTVFTPMLEPGAVEAEFDLIPELLHWGSNLGPLDL